MDDQTPGLEGAGEEALDLELEPAMEPGGDPLDEITDEVVRAEAKKHRAIARRIEKQETPAPVTPTEVTPPVEYVTKADFHKANERQAVREITSDAEIKAHWSEIAAFYTPRRGKETSEDIKEDILDAITLFKARNPEKVTDDTATDLSATTVVKTGGGTVTPTTPTAIDPPNFRLPVQPKDWYGPPK